MTAGEQLVALSGLSGVSALQHLLGIESGSGEGRFIDWNGVVTEDSHSVLSVMNEALSVTLDSRQTNVVAETIGDGIYVEDVSATVDVSDSTEVALVEAPHESAIIF